MKATVTSMRAKQRPRVGTQKQWKAFPKPQGWSMQWDGRGLNTPRGKTAGKRK